MEYWTIIDDRHAGPFTVDELISMGITPDTPVWTSGLPDWVEAHEIAELRAAIELRDKAVAPQEPMPAPQPQPVAPQPAATPHPVVEPQQPSEQPQPAVEPARAYQAPQPQYQAPQYPEQPRWEWQQPAVKPDEPCPPAYLAWSIIVTILCCQVLGIVAIICSAQTKQAYNRGNLAKAKKMSEWAQWMIIISIVFGLISLPIQLAFMGI